MMISEPAMICLNATWQRLMRRAARDSEADAALVTGGLAPAAMIQGDVDTAGETALMAASVDEKDSVLVVHEQSSLVRSGVDASAPLAANERRARAAALRAMALSRERRFDAARTAFAEAAGLDPTLDLTRTPAFWKLERAAHEAAINAYLLAGRDRDAAVLRARVQSTFRPKPLRPRPQAILTP